MPEQSLTALLEALILAAARPVSVRELAAASELSEADTELALSELRQSVNRNCRGIVLREVAGGGCSSLLDRSTNPMYSVYSNRKKSRA